jgi:hypothetical protein
MRADAVNNASPHIGRLLRLMVPKSLAQKVPAMARSLIFGKWFARVPDHSHWPKSNALSFERRYSWYMINASLAIGMCHQFFDFVKKPRAWGQIAGSDRIASL